MTVAEPTSGASGPSLEEDGDAGEVSGPGVDVVYEILEPGSVDVWKVVDGGGGEDEDIRTGLSSGVLT